MGHQGSVDKKVKSIENLDEHVIKPIVQGMNDAGEDYRLVILPDHPTPICIRTHTGDDVPYLLFDSKKKEEHTWKYNEREAAQTGKYIEEGHKLIDHLFS